MVLYNKLLKYHLQGITGLIVMVQKGGNAWSSTLNGPYSYTLGYISNDAFVNSPLRANGAAVRCIKD